MDDLRVVTPPYQLSLFSAASLVGYPGYTLSPWQVGRHREMLADYVAFCTQASTQQLTQLSAALYLEYLIPLHSFATTRRMIDNLRFHFRLQNVPDPFAIPTRILLQPRALEFLPARMHDGPEPLHQQAFRALIEAIPYQQSTLRDVRDRALFLLIFGAFLKGVEVECLDVEHLRFSPNGVDVYIVGRSGTVPLPYYAELEFCVVTALKTLISRGGLEDGALFRQVPFHRFLDKRLRGKKLGEIIQKRFFLAGLPTERMGVEAIRWGALVTAIRRGVEDHVLRRMSGMDYTTIARWRARANAAQR